MMNKNEMYKKTLAIFKTLKNYTIAPRLSTIMSNKAPNLEH